MSRRIHLAPSAVDEISAHGVRLARLEARSTDVPSGPDPASFVFDFPGRLFPSVSVPYSHPGGATVRRAIVTLKTPDPDAGVILAVRLNDFGLGAPVLVGAGPPLGSVDEWWTPGAIELPPGAGGAWILFHGLTLAPDDDELSVEVTSAWGVSKDLLVRFDFGN